MKLIPRAGRLRQAVRDLRHSERGQGLVEYALIIVVVSLGVIASLTFMRDEIRSLFSRAGSSLQVGADGTGGGGGGGGLTDQTITFDSTAPGGATVGGPTYTPTATATSGLTVTFTIDASASSVCSISGGGVVSFTGVGTCVVNANQAGNGTYNPAPQVQQSFAVGAAADPAPTITSVSANNGGGTVSDGDTITIVFSEALNTGSFCTNGDFDGTGNDLDLTLTNAGSGGNNDEITITADNGNCPGSTNNFRFGTLQLGGNYLSGGPRVCDQTDVNYSGTTLTITIGSCDNGGSSNNPSDTVLTYTPDAGLRDLVDGTHAVSGTGASVSGNWF